MVAGQSYIAGPSVFLTSFYLRLLCGSHLTFPIWGTKKTHQYPLLQERIGGCLYSMRAFTPLVRGVAATYCGCATLLSSYLINL